MKTFRIGSRYTFTKDGETLTGRVEGVYRNLADGINDVRVRGYGWLDLNEWHLAAGKTK